MAAIAAPRVNVQVSPDCEFYIASAAAADVNLQTVSAKPNHCPQALVFMNATAAALAVAITPEKGTERILTIPINGVVYYNMPVASIRAGGSGASLQVIAFWWAKAGCQFNR